MTFRPFRRHAGGLKFLSVAMLIGLSMGAGEIDVKQTATYRRLKAVADAVQAIDSHDHLRSFDLMLELHQACQHGGLTLPSLWQASYVFRTQPVPAWPAGAELEQWWNQFQPVLQRGRATSVMRYLLPAFRDLYGVDFEDELSLAQVTQLNQRVMDNYRDPKWVTHVITQRANIQWMLVDPYWAPLDFETHWPFELRILRLDPLINGHHPGRFKHPLEDPYDFAAQRGLPTATLEDYLNLLDRILQEAAQRGVVGLKCGMRYVSNLHFEDVPRERAAAIYGKPAEAVSAAEWKAFQDFVMWRICPLSAEYSLPIQIHTGDGNGTGSNPMLLLNLIEGNPRTRFILFHGGYPWIGESGAIAHEYRNVYLDSCWLPTVSYSMAKRAYQEWLEVATSDRIMWGADQGDAENIYGATVTTRQCLAEALAEKVERGELRIEHAERIVSQVLRENAIAAFPALGKRVKP